MMKPLDSSAARRQLSGAFPHFPGAGPRCPRGLVASPPRRLCQTRADVCGGAQPSEAPEATQERGISTAIQSGKGLRGNFRKGGKRVTLDGRPVWTLPQPRWSGACSQALRSAGQRRARGRLGRCGPRRFAPWPRWPWLRIPAAAWVSPLTPKRAVSRPVPAQDLPGSSPQGGGTWRVPTAGPARVSAAAPAACLPSPRRQHRGLS